MSNFDGVLAEREITWNGETRTIPEYAFTLPAERDVWFFYDWAEDRITPIVRRNGSSFPTVEEGMFALARYETDRTNIVRIVDLWTEPEDEEPDPDPDPDPDPEPEEPLDIGRMFVAIPHPSYVEGTTPTLLGSLYLPAGDASAMRALLGALAPEDTATLSLYRHSDGSLIATCAVTGVLGEDEAAPFTLPSEDHYELRGACSSAAGTAVFRGVEIDMRPTE